MAGKIRSPEHDDVKPKLDWSQYESSPTAAAVPGSAQDAHDPSLTNQTAPVQENRAAVAVSEETSEAKNSMGVVTAGAGTAGMAGTPDVTHPGADFSATGGGSNGDDSAILHVDIDAFFAAIEQQRDPRLRGRPVIVGAGVIASCSYEARGFGLHAGMPLTEARRLCPEVVIMEGHAQVYRCFAEEIFSRCRAIAPSVETFLDEAYCDLSGTERLHGDFLEAAQQLKDDIREVTGLTVTCGIGPNRMLAKLIGKTRKPDGLARIHASEADAFLRDLDIAQLAGVGRSHARTLRSMNINTTQDLRALSERELEALFGSPGLMLYRRCRGHDTAAVNEREVPQSISRETSFHQDTADRTEHEGMMEYLVGRACRTARDLGIRPRTISVRMRYADGQGEERARSLRVPTHADPIVLELALDLLRRLFTRRVALHGLGVTLSNFVRAEGEQGCLFAEREAGRRAALFEAFDRVRNSYGHGVLVSGRALHLKGRIPENEHGFVLRTPSLTK